jgi:hypothetical protein
MFLVFFTVIRPDAVRSCFRQTNASDMAIGKIAAPVFWITLESPYLTRNHNRTANIV